MTRSISSADGTIRVPPTKGVPVYEESSWLASIIVACSYFLVFITFPVSIWFCFKVVKEYERAVIFRLGRLRSGGAKGPGLFFILPCVEKYCCVGLRSGVHDIPPQEVLTKDSVTICVDAIVFYQVSNPLAAVCQNKNYHKSTRVLASTMLRTVLGTKSLSEILSDREAIAAKLLEILEIATDQWGVHVGKVEIKDVKLPRTMQRAMAAEAEATRMARSKVIHAEGEQRSVVALKAAADMLHSSPISLKLRYLQEMNNISTEKNHTIVFPLPTDMLEGLRRRMTGSKIK